MKKWWIVLAAVLAIAAAAVVGYMLSTAPRGVESLHGGSYSIIPDQIEAGTFMAAAAACGGSVLVKNVIPRHLECITAKLREMSVQVTEF